MSASEAKQRDFWKRCYEAASERADQAEALLRMIAKANVIFPSMCANNMEAYTINDALAKYRAQSETSSTAAVERSEEKKA